MKIYYCRAMDGIDNNIISQEYTYVRAQINAKGHCLINDFNVDSYEILAITEENSKKVVHSNISDIAKSDIVIVNLSIRNHSYIGCVGEMIYAKQMGIRVIVIVGESGNDKHFWTLYHSDCITNSLDEAIALL